MQYVLDRRIRGWQRITQLLDDSKTARVTLVLILGVMGSLPLVILTPPFQVPDEVQHFYRAYQLSEFHIRAEVQNGLAGGTLPDSLPQLVKASVYTPDGISYPPTPAPITKTLLLQSIPLNPTRKQFVAFPGSAFYSPLPYLPQVLGICVGRLMGSGPLALLYLGRLFNCLSALGLLGLTMKFIPFAEELIILAGLLPMSLFLYASLSPDATLIGCALVFSALSVSAGASGRWRTGELWMAAAAAVVFCSVKPVYVPMLLAAVVSRGVRPREIGRVIRSHAMLLGIVLTVTVGWLLFARSTMTSPLSGAHPSAQINLVLHQPIFLVRAFASTLNIGALIKLYIETVAAFGWMTVALRPSIAYLLPPASLVILWMLGIEGAPERSAIRACWHLALVFASAALVLLAVYLMWTHVGQDKILGVQGRYFIPILGLAGVGAFELFPSRRPPAPRWQRLAGITIIFVMETAAMDATIIHAFHIF